ncbi:MAG: endo-1,4-beta-xylanase, partial [Bacteroidales bacterium]
INEQGEYTFERGDRIIEFAEENNMLVRGHTLVWHQQTDDWFFRDEEGNLFGEEEMLIRLKTYINTVLDHYRGKEYAWDVVNEAISDKPGEFFREDTDWFRTCGPEYVEKAFVFAKEADPEIKLFYNDYNLIDPDKSQKVYEMVKDFQVRGIPIDGVGMQGHWTLEDVNKENLGNAIDLFASLGMEVQITELDLSIYPFYHNIDRDSLPKEVKEFTEELELKQAEKYGEIFEVLREKSDIVTSVTFWGVADNKTWLSNYFVRGRTDHPLLFDSNYKPKQALEDIMDF